MGTEELDEGDLRLLQAVREARLRLVAAQERAAGPAAAAGAPADLVLAVRALPALHNFEADLAQLISDSAVEPALAGVRHEDTAIQGSRGEERRVTFRSGTVSVEVELVSSGVATQLVGQIFPARGGLVKVLTGAAQHVITMDDSGSFYVEDVPAGYVALEYLDEDLNRPVRTPWVLV